MTSLANLTDRETERLKLQDKIAQSSARSLQLQWELDEEMHRRERLDRQFRALDEPEESPDERA